jgi:DNA-binding beta-propeller fold protein YncE
MMKAKLFLFLLLLGLGGISNSQFAEFAAQYSILSTIAGAGDIDNKGHNGWLELYEGKEAVEAELSRPHFAMADSNGTIYIADKDAHAIRKVTSDGIISTVAGTSSAGDNGDGPATEHHLSSPNGIWVKPDGTFFILDLGNDKIRKVDPEGNMVTIVDDTNGISLGRGIWVSPDEKLIYYASGSSIKQWTQEKGIANYATGFSSLGCILVDPSGHLVATDRGANLVYRVFDDGSKVVIAGNGLSSGGGSGSQATETGLHGVRGIWILEDGSYLLATHEGSQVWYVDTAGIINLFLDGREGDNNHSGDGEHFQTPGYKISEARGVSVDYQGNIIITENDRGFVRKIKKAESSSVVNIGNRSPKLDLNVYPNPFRSEVFIRFYLHKKSHVDIEIYNLSGQKILTLFKGKKPIGYHEIRWEGPINLKSGPKSTIYICKIKTGNLLASQSLIFLK